MSRLNLNLNSELRHYQPGARKLRRKPREKAVRREPGGLLWAILVGAAALAAAVFIWRQG